jgi:gliding motility-associated-like protein
MKMKRIAPLNYLFLILFSINAAAQDAALVPEYFIKDTSNITSNANWTEDTDKRTLFSRTYTTTDGQIMVKYSKRPLNYKNADGKLVPISGQLQKTADGNYAAINQPNPTYLYTDGTAAINLGNADTKFKMGVNCKINGAPIGTNFNLTGNTVLMTDIIAGIDKQFIYRENAVKYNYILKQPVTGNFTDYIIEEELIFPEGYTLTENKTNGTAKTNGWCGDLLLLDNSGKQVSTILAPLCYDAANKYTIGSFKIIKTQTGAILQMQVPMNWLTDASRVLPITIDPLVVGPYANWTGGQMPSCIVPQYNVDSILVTIPAAVTVTGLYITSSYYADPFTTAVMSQGTMYFSTSCGQSQSFTVPNANTPGTAYLDSFNILSPLTCCYANSCSPVNFYLRMHLGRTGPSVGCNTTYIRYDPFTTSWPFAAIILGRTVEAYASLWNVPTTPICSNKCTLNGTVFVRYGVPPYTINHPWATNTPLVVGSSPNCSTGATSQILNLVIPNCPIYCNAPASITVPPPTVVDACGNTITGFPSPIVPLIDAPDVNAVPDSLIVCSGDPFSFALSSCITTSTISWMGNNLTGTGTINDTIFNTGTSLTSTTYNAYASANGCFSDTITITAYVEPLPIANFSQAPGTGIANVPITFTDISSIFASNANSWLWTFGDNTTSLLQNPTHTYTTPGTYTVCLTVSTTNGCADSVCKEITIIPAEILTPNVVTPNGDKMNDLLAFQYLEYYTDNKLIIYNRWGNTIYEKQGYLNDWDGSSHNDGTYYYALQVNAIGKTYTGFFQIYR